MGRRKSKRHSKKIVWQKVYEIHNVMHDDLPYDKVVLKTQMILLVDSFGGKYLKCNNLNN